MSLISSRKKLIEIEQGVQKNENTIATIKKERIYLNNLTIIPNVTEYVLIDNAVFDIDFMELQRKTVDIILPEPIPVNIALYSKILVVSTFIHLRGHGYISPDLTKIKCHIYSGLHYDREKFYSVLLYTKPPYFIK